MKFLLAFFVLFSFQSYSQNSFKINQFCWVKGDGKIVHESNKFIYTRIRHYPANNLGNIRDEFYQISKDELKQQKILTLEDNHYFIDHRAIGLSIQKANKSTGQKRGVRVRLIDMEGNNVKKTILEPTTEVKHNWHLGTDAIISPNGKRFVIRTFSHLEVETKIEHFIFDEELNLLHQFESTEIQENGRKIKLPIEFIDDEGSLFSISMNGKMSVYNAKKDFEKWEQDLIAEGEFERKGNFTNLTPTYSNDKLTLTCLFRASYNAEEIFDKLTREEKMEFLRANRLSDSDKDNKIQQIENFVSIPINSFTKEVEKIYVTGTKPFNLVFEKASNESKLRISIYKNTNEDVVSSRKAYFYQRDNLLTPAQLRDSNMIYLTYPVDSKDIGDLQLLDIELGKDIDGEITAKKGLVYAFHAFDLKEGEEILKKGFYFPKSLKKEIKDLWVSKDGKYAYVIAQKDGFNGTNQHILKISIK